MILLYSGFDNEMNIGLLIDNNGNEIGRYEITGAGIALLTEQVTIQWCGGTNTWL